MKRVRKDMVLPLGTPISGKDGTQLTELHVPKDTTVLLSILGANTNKEMWGFDALEWRPERWLEGLPESVSEAKMPGIYSHL
jgi:cytochrome P450